MKIFFISIFLSPFCLASDYELEKSFSIRTLSIDSNEISSKNVGLSLGLKGTYQYRDDLKLVAGAMALMETGSNKATNNNSFQAIQSVALDEAYLHWFPRGFFDLKLGAINQRVYSSPIFLTDLSFVSALEKLSYSFPWLELYFFAQQAIPSNSDLTQRVGAIENGTPQFFAETFGTRSIAGPAEAVFEATHFQFTDLSRSVAHQSRFRGNLVDGLGQTNAFFLSGFKGTHFLMSFNWSFFDQFSLGLKSAYIVNDKASNDLNKGQLIELNAKFSRSEFDFGFYRNERQASVAFYNSKYLGDSNRKGTYFIFKQDLKNSPTSIKMAFYKYQAIESDLYQTDGQIVTLAIRNEF